MCLFPRARARSYIIYIWSILYAVEKVLCPVGKISPSAWWLMFTDVERMFRIGKHTFSNVECTFSIGKYKKYRPAVSFFGHVCASFLSAGRQESRVPDERG